MTFRDISCGGDSTCDSDKVNYVNATTIDNTKAVVRYTETATSGHHEVICSNESDQKVQVNKQQQVVVSPLKPITGFKQLNYRNNSNNNNFFLNLKLKTFVGKQQKLQQHLKRNLNLNLNLKSNCIVVLLVLFLITIQFHNTCLAIFKTSPKEWLEHCNKTGQVAFVDSQECFKTLQKQQQKQIYENKIDIGDIEWLLMILKCDIKPMIEKFELFLPLFEGGPKELSTPDELNNEIINLKLTSDELEVWRELLAIEGMINYFYSEAMQALSRSDFCTYPTVSKLGQLKNMVLGSRTLSYAYDLIAIKLHTSCLIKTLNKLPQIPYLVKDVVDTYMNGVDNTVKSINRSSSFGMDNYDSIISGYDDFEFDAEEAIAKNGPLSVVVGLSLSSRFGTNHNERHFIEECKNFLIDFEERWQTMEMMSKMLSTDYNGIQRFNNYVIRLLILTKYADACSRLSSMS